VVGAGWCYAFGEAREPGSCNEWDVANCCSGDIGASYLSLLTNHVSLLTRAAQPPAEPSPPGLVISSASNAAVN
jgi:hypothetical protein